MIDCYSDWFLYSGLYLAFAGWYAVFACECYCKNKCFASTALTFILALLFPPIHMMCRIGKAIFRKR